MPDIRYTLELDRPYPDKKTLPEVSVIKWNLAGREPDYPFAGYPVPPDCGRILGGEP